MVWNCRWWPLSLLRLCRWWWSTLARFAIDAAVLAHFADAIVLRCALSETRRARSSTRIRDLKHGAGLNHLPQSGRFAANAAWLAIQSLPRTRYGVMAPTNLARWAARISLGDQQATTKTRPWRIFPCDG